MRILAIRGRNLASLAGDFEVDFLSDPLASAGVFAISGPTGAGKSTVLDALCLALYHETPRLHSASEQQVTVPDGSGHSTTPQDSRNLLRRGCGEGFAEVDFVGIDDLPYRARWQVQRARLKSHGKLQPVRVSLIRLDTDETLGTQTTETAKAIETRIGLSFDQFRRSVLLAQNDFAALLKARRDERAALLEALTNTEVFSMLSKRAHERRVAEETALSDLRQRLAVEPPLPAAERETLDADLGSSQVALSLAERNRDRLHAEVTWLEQGEKLTQQVELATQRVLVIDAEIADRHAEGEALRRWHELASLRPIAQRRAEALRTIGEVDGELDTIAVGIEQIIAECNSTTLASQQLAATLNLAESQHRAALPAITRARALDGQIGILNAERSALQKQALTAQSTRDQWGNQLSDVNALIAQEQAHVERWQAWRQDHRGFGHDDAEWVAIGTRLNTLITRMGDRSERLAKREQSELARSDALSRQHDAKLAVAAADAAEQSAEQVVAVQHDRLATFDPDTLDHEFLAFQASDRLLEQATSALRDRDSSRARLDQANQQLDGLRQQLQQSFEIAERADTQTNSARVEQQAAREALERTRLIADQHTTRLRMSLRPGEPCMVCGATEHPGMGHDDAAVRAILTTLEQQFADATQRDQDATKHHARASAEVDATHHSIAQQEQLIALEHQQCEELISTVECRLIDLCRSINLPEPEGQNEARHHVTLARDTLLARRAEIDERLSAVRLVRSELSAATASAATARKTHGEANRSFALVTKELEPLDKRVQQLSTEVAMLDTQILDARGALASVMVTDTMETVDFNSTQSLWQSGNEWYVAARDAREPLVRHTSERDAIDKQMQSLATEAVHIQARLTTNQQSIDETSELRIQVLDATDVESHARSLHEAEDDARTTHARQLEVQRSYERRLEEAQSTRQNLATRREAIEGTYKAASLELTEAWARAHANLCVEVPAIDQVDLALTTIPADLTSRWSAWTALQDSRSGAEAVRFHAALQMDAWRAEERSSRTLTDTQQVLDEAISEIRNAHSTHATLVARQVEDVRRASQTKDHLDALAQREREARRWFDLAALIGSADGKRFRGYAQQFTLNVLLDYANQHLERLAPRYQLRSGNEEMSLLVVDRDFGDELRSVHSLSGGEGFLVSLALALGLASLSSERVRVESLFIDEGFGSLDADTLNVAMEALDRLQSEGRRVGMISHVHDMAERIGTQIRVIPVAPGRSRLEVVA